MSAVIQQPKAVSRHHPRSEIRIPKRLYVAAFVLAVLSFSVYANAALTDAIGSVIRGIEAYGRALVESATPRRAAPVQFAAGCAPAVPQLAPATLAGPVAGPIDLVMSPRLRCGASLATPEIAVATFFGIDETKVAHAAPIATSGPPEPAVSSAPSRMPAAVATSSATDDANTGQRRLEAPSSFLLPDCSGRAECSDRGASGGRGPAPSSEMSSEEARVSRVDHPNVRLAGRALAVLVLLGLFSGGCWAIYRWQFSRQSRLVRAARRGLLRGEFGLEYRPVFSLRLKKCVGVEADLRWKNPEFGLPGPSTYVPSLASSNVIGPLMRHLLTTATSDLATVGSGKSLYVAVKICAAYVGSHHFVADVRELGPGVLPRLVLELTEEDCASITQNGLESLEALSKDGVRFALRGVGMRPLEHHWLSRFNFKLIKTDWQLLTLADAERVSRLAALADAAHGMGAVLVAEGVESVGQHTALVKSGCDLGQGFFYGRSMTVARLATFVGGGGPSRLN
jgi:EAL domain-containing protein (putative c-di-GMP-specific phosphodiesterase class I)